MTPLGAVQHLGFIVRDIDAAMAHWRGAFGVGPFVQVTRSAAGERVFRGQPVDLDLTLAFAYLGDVQIEIIHQRNAAPSPYSEFLDAGREGLHHFGFWTEDPQAAGERLTAAGFRACYRSGALDPKNGATYYEPPGPGQSMVEVMPQTPAKSAMYARLKALCRQWDGQSPVRRVDSFAAMSDFLNHTS